MYVRVLIKGMGDRTSDDSSDDLEPSWSLWAVAREMFGDAFRYPAGSWSPASEALRKKSRRKKKQAAAAEPVAEAAGTGHLSTSSKMYARRKKAELPRTLCLEWEGTHKVSALITLSRRLFCLYKINHFS